MHLHTSEFSVGLGILSRTFCSASVSEILSEATLPIVRPGRLQDFPFTSCKGVYPSLYIFVLCVHEAVHQRIIQHHLILLHQLLDGNITTCVILFINPIRPWTVSWTIPYSNSSIFTFIYSPPLSA